MMWLAACDKLKSPRSSPLSATQLRGPGGTNPKATSDAKDTCVKFGALGSVRLSSTLSCLSGTRTNSARPQAQAQGCWGATTRQLEPPCRTRARWRQQSPSAPIHHHFAAARPDRPPPLLPPQCPSSHHHNGLLLLLLLLRFCFVVRRRRGGGRRGGRRRRRRGHFFFVMRLLFLFCAFPLPPLQLLFFFGHRSSNRQLELSRSPPC
mmetsp:Transcript_73316/g.138395  ORF Transcript_73316/g.138395 Transcript_73316/m.138395 type:complete len:207 (+) Transcript_73316:304-924(+)